MKSAAPNLIETNALQLTAALLVAFALAFFVYYGIDTMRDPVFAASRKLGNSLEAGGHITP